MSTEQTSEAPFVAVHDACKTYGSGQGAVRALAHVDLQVPRGRFVSVIGPSGCGKSTLLRLVAGLEEPDGGAVRICGRTAAQARAAKMIGFVPQVPALLPWLDVLDNVRVLEKVNRPGNRRESRRGLASDPVALLTRLGLGDVLHRRPRQLSGGMQQRTALARAFALEPQVLLMDEPFSALDEFTRESAQLQLLDVWQELRTTVVFVTHSIAEAVLLSDTVVVMAAAPGRVAGVVDIDLDRPRHHDQLDTAAMHEHEHRVRQLLETAWNPLRDVV
ncbi:ABC transporter ATP-binding protein [Kineococcus rhizosphaerae]|uniref:NitT/TauT family transport system ATP-binding protein n=1 Tax=Kineococcus rhizosphaerae TaxID=559628 RepID=A0A2T0R9G7_9ACTN|nr:ABC transporter ATP-binding protein [Kineococcus rhizosphaerae]PRY17812.1 NitT/TauT family transport system ATP-binding protein [Kineococcus rhizosphaerae]